MSQTPQWYRDYLEDVSQQVRSLDRVRFRRAIRHGVPGLLQHGPTDETLLSVLVADLHIPPAPSTPRCLFVLTSHNLHVYPQQHTNITTFVGDQMLPVWKIDNRSHTIEIPFFPPEVLAGLRERRQEDDSFDHLTQMRSLFLRVHPSDWEAANVFWAAGNCAAYHWGDPAAIMRHFEAAMQKIKK